MTFPMEMVENGNLIGSINGTVFGDVTLVTGKKGLALHTNGVDQYVDFGYQGDTCLGYFILCTHGWVAAFWTHRNNDTRGSVMDTGQGTNKGVKIKWKYSHEMLVFFRSINKKWQLRQQTSTNHGWIHIVIAWCPNYAKLYFNGGRVSTKSVIVVDRVPDTDTPRFVIGADYQYRDGYGGTLDELRVWDTIMSDEDVLELYRKDAGLINWYVTTFNDTSESRTDRRCFAFCLQYH